MRSIKLGLLILLGCHAAYSANNYTQSISRWRGANVGSLTHEWGAPDIKIKNRSGTTTYIYKSRVYPGYIAPPTTVPAIGVNDGSGRPVIITGPTGGQTTLIPGPESLYCENLFEVNKQGIVIGTKVVGVGCP